MAKCVETLVIGGGPAGLTTAYCLAKSGREVTVLEQDPVYLGGISRTAHYKGYLFDIGGHRFFSKSREVVDLWNEILPDDFIERPRLSRIYYRGKFLSYPLKAFEAFRKLGPIESLRCVLSYLHARAFPIKEPKTFHQWVRNHFGERLFSIFFKTYTEKVWGMSCDEISADWAAQRIKGLDLAAALVDAAKRSFGLVKPGSAGAKTLISSFRYPRRGPGMMWEAAADKIRSFGGEVQLGETVTQLTFDAAQNQWRVDATAASGAQTTYLAQNVVSSAPVRDLMAMISPAPISRLQARELRYRDFLTVILIGESSIQLDDNWVYIHDPKVTVGRVQNFRSWSPELIPNDTATCLGLEYFCFEGDGLWDASDADLIDRAKQEIDKIGLMKAGDVADACVVRQPKAYPVYDDMYASHMETVRRDLALNYPNLHLVGRNGMHKYNNQDHAMMTGMLTALNIEAGYLKFDTWQVNEDAEYGESGLAGVEEALQSERLVPRKVA